jgi:hypothetical protein
MIHTLHSVLQRSLSTQLHSEAVDNNNTQRPRKAILSQWLK